MKYTILTAQFTTHEKGKHRSHAELSQIICHATCDARACSAKVNDIEASAPVIQISYVI